MVLARLAQRASPFWLAALVALALVGCARLPGRETPGAPTAIAPPTAAPAVNSAAATKPAAAPAPATTSAPAAAITPAPVATGTPTVGATASAVAAVPSGTPTPTNLALRADVFAPWGQDTAALAVDGNPDTLWYSQQYPPNWFEVILKQPSLVERLELVVAQNPPGRTVHEIWVEGTDGQLQLLTTLTGETRDGQTLTVPVSPPRVVLKVMVRTTVSPSQLAWREVRAIGVPAAAGGVPFTPVATPQLRAEPYARGFQLPVGIVNAGDGSGRLFVLEQGGRVKVIRPDHTVQSESFLDVSAHIIAGGERGLLGLAFPPGYPKKNWVYATYNTADPGPNQTPGDEILVRFKVRPDGNAVDPSTQQVLLVDRKPNELHNGGHLEFGPKDGYLYLGLGDGGPNNDPDNRGQNPSLIYGKVLRLDVESGQPPYAIPPTNPFVGQANRRPETWAWGLRNPWAYTFDRQSGDLWIGDVGEAEWEEVDFQPASSKGGENYGWRVMEGNHCFKAETCDTQGLVTPVAEIHHSEGCAMTGGAVAHAPRYPRLDGAFVFGDFCSGRIWGVAHDGAGFKRTQLFSFDRSVGAVGLDEQGTLYAADYGPGAVFALLPAS